MEKESKDFVIKVKPPIVPSKPKDKPKSEVKLANSASAFKQNFLNQASKQLEAFLNSDKKIIFHYHENPAVSIIIVTYTQTALELLCFLSILRWLDSKFPYEVIISNNGSSEENCNLLGRLINANIIHHNENKGFVGGVNCGVEQARGEYVLLLNDDAMLTYNCVQTMAKRLSSWKTTKIGVVGAQIRLLNNTIQDAGGILRSNGEAEEYSKGRNPDIGDVNFVRETNYVSGACLMTPRELFLELGMFDESFSPGYCEESDYCLRVQEAGYKVIYDPKARVIHYEYGSGNSERAAALVKEHTELLRQKHQETLGKGYSKSIPTVIARTTKKYRGRVLIVDDFVPRIETGDGELVDYIKDLVDKDFFVTYFPQYSGVDDWMSAHDWLPDSVEVMLYEDVGMLQNILAERPNFYDYFVSKTFDFSDLRQTSAALSGKYVIQMEENENFTSSRLLEIPKPTVLWIDWHIPEYDTNAGDYAVYSYCSSLQRLGFKVGYWSDDRRWNQQDPKYMEFLLQQKWDVWNTAGFSFDQTISDRGNLVDLVVVARPLAIKYLTDLRKKTRAPIIYYCHDLHYLRETRQFQTEGKGLSNAEIRNRMESITRIKEIEHQIIKNTDLLVTVSQHERDIINKELPEAKVSVWPWYCPTKPLHPDDDNNDPIILFIGGMQHTPNQDAIRWFTQEIFPLVKQQVKDAKLVIIGEKAPPDIASLHNNKDIHVKGHVEYLTPFLHGASLLVAPVRYGAGFKGKIAMAMSHSLPVVTTTIGAEGMGLSDGINVLVADTAEDFTKKVCRVLQDTSLRCDLRNGSIIHAAMNWSSDVVDSALKADIEGLNVKLF